MFFLGAISEPLLYCLIGPKWHEAAVYLPLICITGSTYPLHAINLNMLQVQGRSDLFFGLEVIKKIIGIAPLSVCIFYGILPMLYTSILTNIIGYFLNSYYSGKFLGYSSWMQIKDIAPSYGIATLVALSVFFLKYLPISLWIALPLQIILGSAVLLCVCQKTKMEEYVEIKRIVEPYFRKVKR
jgi:O-antigen/teichoic acid export membrane protein